MTMLLSEEQELLRDSAQTFLQEMAPIEQQRRLRDDKVLQGFDSALWQQMLEMGWSAAVVPENYGGLEAGYLGFGSVFEALGQQLAAQPLLSQGVMAPELLLRAGNTQQQTHWLPLLATGAARVVLALEDVAGKVCAANADGSNWRLTGEKSFVIDGVGADALVVSARLPDGQQGLWLLPATTPGVSVHRQFLVDSRNLARVCLDNVTLTPDMALTAMSTQQALDAALDRGCACLAAEALGLLREVFARTLAYLKERVQFDVPIGSFQALQHRAARLYVELELLESSVLGALEAIDAGNEAEIPLQCSLAKAKASDLCEKLCNEAIQMHGGIGVTDELDIGLFFKRARVLQRLLGDGAYHRRRYATLKGF